jgi:hypothetical protein
MDKSELQQVHKKFISFDPGQPRPEFEGFTSSELEHMPRIPYAVRWHFLKQNASCTGPGENNLL